ncbi:MAG TPA: DUF1614 domain-containing protein [Candidatus Binataceae bacterium]|nr:DUF1614 domain-containing protein [Candidatus Binataceae bacterium]
MIFAPFIFIYALILFLTLAIVVLLFEINLIHYVFEALGLPPELAFFFLLASLAGSYLNIPVTRVRLGELHTEVIVRSFGVRYRVPVRLAGDSTVIAVNVGGAVVPVLISLYVLGRWPGVIFPALVGVAIVTLVVNRFARPVPGMGIATPMLIPPIVAALAGYFLGGPQHHADAVAYVSGVMGTLIGADLMNIRKIGSLGAPVASIGGAGTFDGIFLTGIVAVLLA